MLAPGRGVVDHDRSGGADAFGPFTGHGPTRRHEHKVGLGEVECLHIDAFDNPVAVSDLLADGATRSDCVNLISGELEFLQDGQDFPAHIACGANDGDAIAHKVMLLHGKAAKA